MLERSYWFDGDTLRYARWRWRRWRPKLTPSQRLQRAINAFFDGKSPAPTIDEVIEGIGQGHVLIAMYHRSPEFEDWLTEMDVAARARDVELELFYDSILACCSDAGMWKVVRPEPAQTPSLPERRSGVRPLIS